MTSLRDGLVGGIRDAYCSNLRNQPQWWSNLRNVLTPSPLREWEDFVNGWVCGDQGGDFPPPPFDGGQCPGVAYSASWVNNASGLTQGIGGLTGPVSGFTTAADGQFRRVLVSHAGGVASWIYDSAANPDRGISGFEVFRPDNQPDDCGSPPPILPPPAPINIDVDVTYGDNNQFNVTVPVVFAPVYVSLDGSVNVPVTVNISPNIELNGTLELFPDFDLDLNFPRSGGPGDSQPDPSPPPADPDGPGTPEDPSPETPEEPESRVYALLIRGRIESDARPSGIYQEIGPDIYAPRLGSARFGSTVDGVTFWTEDVDIKGLNSVVQCPIPWGANRFAVNASPGVSLNYVPIFTAPKEWPPFLQLGNQFASDNR